MPEMYKIKLTDKDIEVARSWIEDTVYSGHWGNNIVESKLDDMLSKIFKHIKKGEALFTKEQVEQLLTYFEKLSKGHYGAFRPVASMPEIALAYKLNNSLNRGEDFLKSWEVKIEHLDGML